MKMIFFFLLLLFSVTHSHSDPRINSALPQSFEYRKSQLLIFPDSISLPMPGIEKFSPTLDEVKEAEDALHRKLKSLNLLERRPYQNPVIDQNLTAYLRQYMGFKSTEGHRILLINALWKESDPLNNELYKSWIVTVSGGSKYWSVQYDLNSHRLFGLLINNSDLD